MYSLEWLIGSIFITALVCGLIAYRLNTSSTTKKQALKLEEDLAETQAAFEAYRKEVFEEFSETATRFRTLNESYVDLHQHLARSANALCGEAAASSLLEAPIIPGIQKETEKTTEEETVAVQDSTPVMASDENPVAQTGTGPETESAEVPDPEITAKDDTLTTEDNIKVRVVLETDSTSPESAPAETEPEKQSA